MDLKVKDGETFLCIGDSITDCGRTNEAQPLGNGYVKIFNDLVIANFPQKKIKIINRGIGGNTLPDLKRRWEEDVIKHKPDWLSIMIGINDIHRFLSKDIDWENCSPESYLNDYLDILKRTKEKLNCKIILLEPFYISMQREDAWQGKVLNLLEEYRTTVRQMSKEFQTSLIRLQDIFQEHLKYRDAETFCPEPVHPNFTGHFIIGWNLFKSLLI